MSGDGNDRIYGPDFLLSGDNIVVTFNYRVGIMGFLNLYTDDYAGNMGLKDQRLALKWVYENIENFSGIKDQIVIMGDDAGNTDTNPSKLFINLESVDQGVCPSSTNC